MNYYTFLICLIAAFGGLLFGFDIAIFSGTIPFIQPYYHLTEAELGWTGSSLYIGCIIGTLITGFITDKFGRKIPLILSAGIFALSSVMMGWAADLQTLITWRIIAGTGVGAASMLSPLYIAEISPAKNRGRMVAINQLAIVIGILTAYLCNYFLAGLENNWRWMFTAGAIPASLFFGCVFLVPESPRWLVSKGLTVRARIILNKLAEKKEANHEIAAIEKIVTNEVKGHLHDLLQPGVRYVVFLGLAIAVLMQLSGANAIFFYAPIIFNKAGMNVSDQLFQQILIGSINLVFTLVAMLLVDKLGRRILMLAGSGLMGIWLGLLGICYYYNLFHGFLLSFIVLGYIATYAATLAPVTWVLISEIFPVKIRGVAISVTTCALWSTCFALAYGFPVLIHRLEASQVFFLFSGSCFFFFLVLLKFAPETKGKTLEEVEMGISGHQ